MARRNNPLKPLLDKLPAPLKNKYVLTLMVFFFIIIFVNRITPLTQLSLQNTKKDRIKKKEYYEGKLEEVKNDKIDNVKNVEKFAREKYYMKKKNEDVFIIVEEEKEQ